MSILELQFKWTTNLFYIEQFQSDHRNDIFKLYGNGPVTGLTVKEHQNDSKRTHRLVQLEHEFS